METEARLVTRGQGQVDEIDLVELFLLFWRHRFLLGGAALVCALLAFGVTFVVPKKYQARVVVAPVSDDLSAATSSSSLGGLGGLASLVGLSSPADDNKAVALATLESGALASAFIQERNLRPVLFAKQWDARTGAWKAGETAPTQWRAVQKFAKLLDVSTEKKNGLVILSITWRDARQAAEWANGLVFDANAYLKARALTQVRKNIDYLESQAKKSDVVETRQSVYDLLRGEIRKEMLAAGSEEYSLRVVDPALVPEKQSSPNRLLWVAAGAVVGVIVGLILVLTRARGRRRS